MRLFALTAALAACSPKAPKADVSPPTVAEAKAFNDSLFASITKSCDEAKLDPLIDHDALAAAFGEHSHLDAKRRDMMAAILASRHSGAKILCSWIGSPNSTYKLLSNVDAHPLVRKIVHESDGKTGVTYYKFTLGKSRSDGVVRIVDVYSYLEGAGLAEMLSQIADTALEHNDAFSLRDVMNRVRELRQQGKPAEAIAELGKLSPEMQQLRYIRILRAGLAKAMSQADYLRELDELAKAFPDDPAVALVEIDGAVLHGDYAAALHDIDIVDKDVGGDAFQDAVRADVYLKQGDIAKAAARAEAAVKAEPTLPRAWYAKLDVLLHEGDWPGALAVIDRLATLGSRLTDAGMRKVKAFDELLATPEYAAWHDAHP